MSRFTIPRDLYYGDNAMEELKNLKGCKKAIIVTGGFSMKRGGFLDKCEKILKDTGLEVKIFDGVEPDPSIETVYKGAEAMRAFNPDVIVALGGGSALDAAKAMWVFYEYPEKKFDDIKTPFTMPKLRKKAIFAAIPSTSGTASLVNKVKELNTKLGIKQTYKENGVTEDHFKQKCDSIAKNAVADPCTASNPRETDEANMKKVLEAAYYGQDVNF